MLPLVPSECGVIWNKGLCKCNEGEDPEMISSWITAGLKFNGRCPYKRPKRVRQRHREEGQVKMEAETGGLLP